MKRSIGSLSLVLAVASAVAAGVVSATGALADVSVTVGALPFQSVVVKTLLAAAFVLGFNGLYFLVLRAVLKTANKRRAHDARNVLRLLFGALTLVAVLGVLTEQWVGVLFSLGVVGFAVTFALQQPLLSLLGWFYIMLKRPYAVGDRIQIDDTKGDVIAVDFLVTTVWEINGGLVSSNQPSGRVVTVPNSVVLSAQVVNFGGGGSPYVWNEVSIQVAYETDLDFARETMISEATDFLGAAMADNVAEYREALAETPVELEVAEKPTVNVTQGESWVELRLRYLVHPRRGQRVKNELYSRILARFNEHPERIAFPVSRNR